jgi:hypothetical protein
MPSTKHIAVGLSVLLILSNAWWAYRVFDGGISYTYLLASHDTATAQLVTAKAVVNAAVQSGASRHSIIQAAQVASQDTQPFEKDGAVWVGQLGLQFTPQGNLAKVITVEDTP